MPIVVLEQFAVHLQIFDHAHEDDAVGVYLRRALLIESTRRDACFACNCSEENSDLALNSQSRDLSKLPFEVFDSPFRRPFVRLF